MNNRRRSAGIVDMDSLVIEPDEVVLEEKEGEAEAEGAEEEEEMEFIIDEVSGGYYHIRALNVDLNVVCMLLFRCSVVW